MPARDHMNGLHLIKLCCEDEFQMNSGEYGKQQK